MYMRAMDAVGRKISVQSVDFSVREGACLGNHVDDIHPEAVDPLVQPPAHHGKHFLAHLRIVPVQVRLFGCKYVQIILLPVFVIGPGGAAEPGAPVVRRSSLPSVPPDVIIPVWIGLRGSALYEPFMLIRRMVHHKIHDDFDVPFMAFLQQKIKILHGSEFLHDASIIGNVVSVVTVGGLIYRVKPQHVRAQVFQIIQLLDNSPQIPDSVAVAVFETSDIDLIYNRFFPPCFLNSHNN